MYLAACCAIVLAQIKVEDWKTVVLRSGYTVDSPIPMPKIAAETPGLRLLIGASMWGTEHKGTTLWALVGEEKTAGPPVAHEILASFVSSLLAEGGVTVRAERDLLFRGWPGVEIEMSFPHGIRDHTRCYVVNSTIFAAAATWEGKKASLDTGRFVRSMVIPAKLGNGPKKVPGPDFEVHQLPGAGISLRLPAMPERRETPIGFPPGASKMIAFRSSYINRHYALAYLDLPDEAADGMEEHQEELFKMLHDQVIRAAQGKDRKDNNYLFETRTVLSSTARFAPGNVVRIDTFAHGLRVYSLIAVVPEVLLGSDEVTGFFSSRKLTPG